MILMDIEDGTTTSWCPSIKKIKKKKKLEGWAALWSSPEEEEERKKLLPYPTSIANTFELCIVWLLTVFSSSLTKNELYWDMEQIFSKINDLFHTTATNPLTVELTWKKKIWRWSKGEKNCGFCSGNAQLLLLEPTKMFMANVCLTEMGPNVFFCVCETMGVVGQCVPEICRNLIWWS